MNRINLLKTLDKIVGKPAVFLLSGIPRGKRTYSQEVKKILLIRPGGIGDAVLLLPAIHLLKKKFPEAKIDILCEKRNAGIFGLSNKISTVYLYDKDSDLFRCLKNNYDVVIDSEQWHRLSAVIAYLSGASMRIGFATNERKKLFTHGIGYSHDEYEVYSFFHLIAPLIGEDYEFKPGDPFIDAGSFPIPESLSASIGENKDLIALFPGASIRERRWGGVRFGKTARILHDKGFRIIILGSAAERSDAEIIRKFVEDAIDLTGRTNLRDVATILKMSRLLITTDSGIMHIAFAVGTPTVSLFGPGREKKWAPPGKRHLALSKDLACSPCTEFGYTPACKKNAECLFSISVDDVIEKSETILKDY